MFDDRQRHGGALALWLRRTIITSVLVAFATLVPCFAASAAGLVVKAGEPSSEEQPAVAVNGEGTAVVAWADTRDLSGALDFVQYCVLPLGETTCTHSGNLIPADGAQHVDRVQVLQDGTTVVILADVYGAAGVHSKEYEPEQEWESTDGGAIFTAVDGGKSVADGVLNADTQPLSAMIVPGTGFLAYGWDTAGSSPPTFAEFPLTAPPQCSGEKPCVFAELEPGSNPDQLGNEEGAFASQLGSNSGVMGVFETLFTGGPLGCAADFGTAYAYASGFQSASNNYNISPGSPNSAWKVALSQADCDTEYPAVGGGPSGFGLLEDDLGTNAVVYHSFDEGTQSFDTPLVTVAGGPELDPSLSQDSSGHVYATYLAGAGGAIRLAYSSTGGSTWTSNALQPGGDSHLNSTVNEAGQGWAVWTNSGSVLAQSFTSLDAAPPAPTPTALATGQTSGTTTGADITVPVGTVGEYDDAAIAGTHATTAVGTVTYGLYSSNACTPASLVMFSSAAVTAGKAGASAPVAAVLREGVYYWQAAYGGDAANLASKSTCGSEVLTVTKAAAIAEAAAATSKTITATVTCTSVPCTVTVTITFEGASVAKKKKHKPIVIATGKFTIHKSGPQKLTLHLTAAGRRLLAAHHGRLKATLHVSQKIDGHTELTSRTIRIKPVPKHKK